MKIGLEVHVALPTRTKLFCSDLAYENQDIPNSNVCPTCSGLPGSKPVLNRKAFEISANIAHALKCSIPKSTWFVRKVYFYPDLPKGYQITQLDGSIGKDGLVKIKNKKSIRIRRVQIEEDPAKIVRGKDYSLIDFNRSGVPLNEIVTEPDISNLDELKDFVEELRSILYYVGVDINQEMKIDLNISLAENRVEVKNITGIRNLINAAEYEIKRQSLCIKNKEEVKTETRTYNEQNRETFASREKETEEEYGFIFEPDLAFYDTSKIELEKCIIASEIAHELAENNVYRESVIRELILFNKHNLYTLLNVSKEEFPKAVALIEKFASFGYNEYSDEQFKRMLKHDIYNIDKEKFVSLLNGKEVEKEVPSDEIINYIKEIIKKENLQKRGDDKFIGFLIGKVKNSYHIDAARSRELITKAIKDMEN